MPFLCEFNTKDFHPASDPKPDTGGTVGFPRPLVARPRRLAHGFRELDIDATPYVRARSTIPYFSPAFADCHISTWGGATLRSGIASIFGLKPADFDFLTGECMRKSSDPSSVRVNFERRFVTPPNVVVFFNSIDLGKDANWRINVSSSDIDTGGFTLHIETWGDSIMYGINAGWIAYPEDREHIFSASVNTMDVRPVSKPQIQQSKDIVFGADTFSKAPSVFVALNYLDIDHKASLRVNAYVDGVTKTGLVCHIDTQVDTILYAAGVSIIAFD